MAYKIERHLTKDQILEVYLNQIYLGQRSYGFAAAARTYFGKSMNELTIGEAATIAGLPVAPSTYNPIVNPHARDDAQKLRAAPHAGARIHRRADLSDRAQCAACHRQAREVR